MELIDDGKYFTLHAGRQTGKTTSLQWLADHYNAGTRYCAVWFDLQTARDAPDPAVAFEALLDMLDDGVAQMLPDLGVPAERRERFRDRAPDRGAPLSTATSPPAPRARSWCSSTRPTAWWARPWSRS